MEIKSSELRIGNIVFDEDMHPMYIAGLYAINSLKDYQFKDSAGNSGSIKILSSIPLTEEILLKCGFNENDYYFIIGDFILRKPDFVVCDMEIKVQPKSLHQLQNLHFALTGKELTVNL